ncbi:type IV conjugative transfer system coupling protein TraD [Cysteiniphilum marinum]|uniref:type IV conjugative transfer system coupling protein TraD n=1 Tax=Cysteiniphilum marinum TaxID=2774191 RepID=UPI001939D3A4|nr:type IV conjugative transfer system coupling protein TraD [Cysteiniphilum marinum]
MSNTKSFIRGTQIFFYNMSMFFQSIIRLWKWGLAVYIVFFLASLYFLTSSADINTLFMQIYAALLHVLGHGDKVIATDIGRGIQFTASHIAQNKIDQQYFWQAVSRLKIHAMSAWVYAILGYLLVMAFFVINFIKRGGRNSKDTFVSGTRLARHAKETIKSVKRSKDGASNIKLCHRIPLPLNSERQGIMIHGSNGTGKSQEIMRLLDDIRASGDLAIIYDKECTLKPYFFDQSIDKELNPLSVSCEHWDIWKECRTPIDMAALAMYLMPKAVQGSDPFWVDAARTIFSTVAWKMRHQEDKSIIKLLQVLLTTSLDELRGILKGTEAENLVSRDIEKTAISIRAVMATYTKSLRFLEGLDKDQKKSPFAIRDWVSSQINQINKTSQANQKNNAHGKKGWLYISSRANFHAEIKPLISAWLGMALKSVQSLEPHSTRRVWIIMDEMASLNRLEGFSDIVADIRKFGGCVVIGLQSISQLNFIYGRDEATAITDNMNTSVYFRSPKKQVAQWVSQDLGEQIIEEIRESQSYGPNIVRDGNTISHQRMTRPTVDTATIMNLENLTCYVRLAGNHPITRIANKFKTRHKLIEHGLVERVIDYDAIEKVTINAAQAETNPERNDAVKIEQKVNKANDIVAKQADLADKDKLRQLSYEVEDQEASIAFHDFMEK